MRGVRRGGTEPTIFFPVRAGPSLLSEAFPVYVGQSMNSLTYLETSI